jgi:hypothetical protein
MILPPTIKYHPHLYHKPTKRYYPAMIGAITIYPSSKITGLHRTWLEPDGSNKAEIEPNKMMLGTTKGGAVRLATLIGKKLAIAEGIESALSYYLITGITTWATLSTAGMQNIILPPLEQVSDIIIVTDNDEAGINAAHNLKARLLKDGYVINIVMPEQEGFDFNDVLLWGLR